MRCCKRTAYIALVCCACGQPSMADPWAPTWVIEGDPTLSLLHDSKSELDTCIGRTNRYMTKLPDHDLTIGVYIDSTGRAMNLAVLNSSGQQNLDNATMKCIRQARFKSDAKPGKPVYTVFKMAWKALPMPTSCEPTMTPAATVTVKLLPDDPEYDALASTAAATVCACLKEGEQKPSAPAVILSSSGNARLDKGAESTMYAVSAKRWSDGIPGCAAYKVRFIK
jgi:TonB family protein